MLNFYLVSAARHMINDNDSSSTWSSKFKTPSVQKIKDLPKTCVSSNNRLKISDQKKIKIPVFAWRTKQRNQKTPNAKTEHELCSQEEINWSKIEKSIQIQTVGTLQD